MSDPINPDHYKLPQGFEWVDIARSLAPSEEAWEYHCRMTALYDLGRAGRKEGNEKAQEAAKARWWLAWCEGRDPRD